MFKTYIYRKETRPCLVYHRTPRIYDPRLAHRATHALRRLASLLQAQCIDTGVLHEIFALWDTVSRPSPVTLDLSRVNHTLSLGVLCLSLAYDIIASPVILP